MLPQSVPRFVLFLLVGLQVFQHVASKELGEDCSTNEECSYGESGILSICGPENICICNENSIPNNQNTKCYEKVNVIGDPCEINAQCSQGPLGNLSYCDIVGNMCRCNLLFSVPNSASNKCLPLINTIGALCEENVQCQSGIPGPNSICKIEGDSEQATCQCDDYSVTVPGQQICLQKRDQIGDQCLANIQCTVKIGNLSECQSGTCQCREDEAIGNFDGTKCLKAGVPIGQPCEQTNQCVGYPNSVCSTSRRCDCFENFVPSSPLDDCLQIINELGHSCKESQQCSSGIPGHLSACIENECKCSANATSGYNEHVCRPKAALVGDNCEITAQCTVNLGHSFCQENTCVCLSEAVISRDRTRCLLKAYLGEECEEDSQCSHVDHSVCVGNMRKCQCDAGYNIDPSGRFCVREDEIVKVGQPCNENSVCPGIPGISSGCSISGYCGCLAGFVQSRDLDDCLPIRNLLGDSCIQNHQCKLGLPGIYSDCVNGKCNCTDNAISGVGGNLCYRKATMLRDQCTVQEQCIANLGSSICIEETCQCFDGFKQSFDNKKCI